MEILKTHTMWIPKLALLFLTLALLQPPALAEKKSYVVYLGAHAHPAEEQSLAYVKRVHDSHHQFLSSFVGSLAKAKDSIFYSYEHHINGFAATLDEKEAAEIAKHPKVVSVFLNKGRQLHTSHSWEFMMLEKNGKLNHDSIWENAKFGKDTIIANIDSGVWPESPSFSDEGYGPIPKKWRGTCQNNTKSIHGAPCNRKLIGASFYNKGYPYLSLIDPIQRSARDFEGHGSHTLSTAGGNFVKGASLSGVYNGTTKGGSPRARVAAYKVCWPEITTQGSCFDADILKALDTAIHDGVDVISMSLGGDPEPHFQDAISIGSFHAVQRGIVVVASGGNSGPQPRTVSNLSPWIITVGASTTDRVFRTYVELGNDLTFTGESKTAGPLPEPRFYPLVNALQAKASNASGDEALVCTPGALDPEKVKGKIVLCLRGGGVERMQKGRAALLAGAAGMILRNGVEDGDSVSSDGHVLPASHINYKDGLAVLQYINSSKNPTGYITVPRERLGRRPAPKMASFSSVGPNVVTPEILKPDVTAPGVDIIAAYTSESLDILQERTTLYTSMDGTSMSCPHVSGVAGLLKTLHPHWSPSAIKSAIMTTARVRDDFPGAIQDSFGDKATPFHYGSGHLRPNRAQDPGLVYDLSTDDYLNFLCALGFDDTLIESFSQDFKCPSSSSNALLDFNYPSITVPQLSKPVTVSRKLKNVGSPGKYIARVHHPLGVEVSVEPKVLEFKTIGEEKSFKLSLRAKGSKGISGYTFGGLVWSDGVHYVRSPIVVSNGSSVGVPLQSSFVRSLNV